MLTSSAGFRCLSNLWGIFQEALVWNEAPTHSIIRQWLMKLGLFKLQRTHLEGEWMLVVDATIQMGPQKVLLVLGIRIDNLQKNYIPTYEDAEPLVMKIVENCPGEVIEEVILEAKEKVGLVRGIVSDAGSEMKKGMRLLDESGQNSIHLFDIIHLISNLLKNDLKNDDDWLAFKQDTTHMTQVVKLSDLAHLAPPRLRSKERLMASVCLIKWGCNLLAYVDALVLHNNEVDPKVAWIFKYRKHLSIWRQLHDLGEIALLLVHEQGYHQEISTEWNKSIALIDFINPRTKSFAELIKALLQKEGLKVPEGEHLLGSSVIIESSFGKFKQIEGHHASSGITTLVLALAAIFGKTDNIELAEALKSVSRNDLKEWLDENLGQTYLSKRKMNLNPRTKDIDPCEYSDCQAG